ncbi:thioredoxin, mitochondrial [Protopterus annectens]|uniref:thioredoxin, mitochondrial n=1 Tax=Protopterus annectens TaxID=7888 RepID=UPI001CFA7077|nr:thioredoxin, mitochondrial [Protopterus annectens]XP_043931264.1 thioredoxin, mitochondrial [Protopterus annectens]
MAHRIFLRRIVSLSCRELPGISQSHFSGLRQSLTTLCNHSSTVSSAQNSLLHSSRMFFTSAFCRDSFIVQDGADFNERVINSDKPVVVDFHADWCGPCKILGPRLEKAVAKQNGKVTMAKVNIDDLTDLAFEYEVSAVPTVIAVKNGNIVDKFVGVKEEDQLEAFIRKLIGG